MKLLHGGIHRRLGFIIQHTGGYDKEYHITTIAKKLNIDRDIISNLFNEASSSNLSSYLELLENNVPVDKVFKLMDQDNRIITAKVRSTFGMLERFSSGNYF